MNEFNGSGIKVFKNHHNKVQKKIYMVFDL